MNKQLKAESEQLSPPGDDILETIEHLKMTQAELAAKLQKPTPKVNDLISGKEPITLKTAMQLEKVLGISAAYWMNREERYRTKLAQIEEAQQVENNDFSNGWGDDEPEYSEADIIEKNPNFEGW